jgi:hypothetical protein
MSESSGMPRPAGTRTADMQRKAAATLLCPGCGGDIRLIAFITDPAPIRKILIHLGEPLEPPPLAPSRGPLPHFFATNTSLF